MQRPKLHDYQEYARDFIVKIKKGGLFLSMGLGKTLITLDTLYEINPKGHVLIIAPINIAKITWLEEIKKWGYPFRTQSLVLNEKGKKLSKQKREKLYEKAYETEPTVYIINQELVADLIDYYLNNKRKIWPFTTIVVDELQAFKTYNSKRTKALKKVTPYTEYFIGLTGTPTPNGLLDLWSEIYFMDDGKRLGKSMSQYRERYFQPNLIVNNHPVSWKPLSFAENEIYSKIADIVMSIKNPSFKIPDITYNNYKMELDPKDKEKYKKFVKEYVLELDGGIEVTASNAAVLTAKLSQMASGAIYINDKHEYEQVHTKKLEMLEYILDNETTPTLVAYHFKTDLILIEQMLKKKKIKYKIFDGTLDVFNEWNSGELPVMLIQPMSTKYGLNFQDGGHTLIWYTIPWSLETYLQTNARIHRQGQKNPVVIHHLIIKNTIDEKILKALNRKNDDLQSLMDAVNVTLKEAN